MDALIKAKRDKITKKTLQNIGVVFIGIVLFVIIPSIILKDILCPMIFSVLCVIAICLVIRSFLDLNEELNTRIRLKQAIEIGNTIITTIDNGPEGYKVKTMYIKDDKVYMDTLYDYDILPILFNPENKDKISIQVTDELDVIITL